MLIIVLFTLAKFIIAGAFVIILAWLVMRLLGSYFFKCKYRGCITMEQTFSWKRFAWLGIGTFLFYLFMAWALPVTE